MALLIKRRQAYAKISILSLLLILIFVHPEPTKAQDPQELKVGALLSLSGGLEQWCKYIQQGIELATSEEDSVRVKVLFEDDHSADKKSSLSAIQKLIQIDKVDFLFSWTTSSVPILAPVANSNRTPFLVGAYDANVSKSGPYVFGAFINFEIISRQIADLFIKRKNARRLGLVLAADDWSQNFEAPFRDEAKKLGFDLVFSETISPHETDTRSLVLRLKKDNVDAVLAPLYAGSLFSFIKETREMKFPGIISVGDGMFQEDIKTIGISSEGVYASQIWVDSPEFLAIFKKHFGQSVDPLQLGLVASGYDWVKHIQGAAHQILQNGRKISRETLTETLKTYQSEGYLGKQMYGAPPAQAGERNVVVQNGHYIPVE